jgi:DNA processing protein
MLINHFGTPEAVISASASSLRKIHGIDLRIISNIKNCMDITFGDKQFFHLEKQRADLITLWDKIYPLRLKSIFDAPVFFFYQGCIDLLDKPAIAIVGTRIPSSYGRQLTMELTEKLVKTGFVIVSGLARGVDTVAHQTALRSGGKTIAVLGGALDWIYPPENKELAVSITENGGLLSEYPMRTKPEAMNFPKRNRIISGLSLGVLVTEAGENSGALLTAYNALEQNREVFSVPGPITSERSRGTNFIIKEGAKLVQNVQDITDELCGQMELFKQKQNVNNEIPPTMDLKDKRVFEHLRFEPVHVDQIAADAGLSTSETLSILLTLELNGLVRQYPGKMFKKS